jgi:hypothetical protein
VTERGRKGKENRREKRKTQGRKGTRKLLEWRDRRNVKKKQKKVGLYSRKEEQKNRPTINVRCSPILHEISHVALFPNLGSGFPNL